MDYISPTQLILAFFGSRQHSTISEENIKRGFIGILVIAAILMLIKMVH